MHLQGDDIGETEDHTCKIKCVDDEENLQVLIQEYFDDVTMVSFAAQSPGHAHKLPKSCYHGVTFTAMLSCPGKLCSKHTWTACPASSLATEFHTLMSQQRHQC